MQQYPQYQQMPPGQQMVKTYIGTNKRDKDIKKLNRQGWRVHNMTSQLIGRGAKKFLIGFLAAQRQQWTVVYVK